MRRYVVTAYNLFEKKPERRLQTLGMFKTICNAETFAEELPPQMDRVCVCRTKVVRMTKRR